MTDFTLEELLELRLVQQFEFRDQSFNNLYTIPTFEEYCQLAQGWFLNNCTEFIITDFFASAYRRYDSYDMSHTICCIGRPSKKPEKIKMLEYIQRQKLQNGSKTNFLNSQWKIL